MMPQLKKRTPSYRLHKPTGQAVVSLTGKDHYLGQHGSGASKQAYDRLIGEWLAHGRRLPSPDLVDHTVVELIAAYWAHVQSYYVKDGRPTSEVQCTKQAMRFVKRPYGSACVSEFRPSSLKAVRQAMIDHGMCRRVINLHVGRIKRMFKWGVENELVPANVFHALQAVSGLRRGRSSARESMPVRPIDDAYVDAIRPFVSRQVWAMIELQRLSGMRPGEVVAMCGRDLDMRGSIWLYTLHSHKTSHHGYERVVELGPRSQRIIKPFLRTNLDEHLFSAADAMAEHRADKHDRRKTALSCGNAPGTNVRRHPKKAPRAFYDTDSYRRAITSGCDKADETAKREEGVPADSDRVIPRWHPHQLRHNYATMIRREHGIENARILLGHRSVAVTEVYAEFDRAQAREIVARIG